MGKNKEVDAPEPVIACAHGATGAATLQASGWVAPVSSEPKIGDTMPDGSIFAGISPETNKPMYATPGDAPTTYTFYEAQGYAKKMDAHGHQDWRVPTKAELAVLCNHRAAIGGFKTTGSYPAEWYWSASQKLKWGAWAQRFSDGCQNYNYKRRHSSLRCVR